jgi:hypothetical protein
LNFAATDFEYLDAVAGFGLGFVAPTFDCVCPDVVVLGDIVGSHDDDVDVGLLVSLAPGRTIRTR